MDRRNNFHRYIFRKDLFWKTKEKLLWFIRNNSRDAYKDQRELLKYVKNGNIFDVGAYIGNTVKLYRNYFPGYKIFCFEPFIDSYYQLNNRFSDDPNISIFNKAIGCKDEKRKLYLSNFPNLNSLHKPKQRLWGFNDDKSVVVETITLDDFCSKNNIKHIDILKLDVQGSELDILKGCKRFLEGRKISLIYIEWQVVPLYENHRKYYRIAEFLENYNYELFNIYNINEARSGQLRWADAIYTSKRIRDKMIDLFGEGTGSGW